MTGPSSSSGMPMTVGVVGVGYVGLSTALGMTALGHPVLAADIDRGRVDALSAGRVVVAEPGMESLLADALAADRIRFVHVDEAFSADVVFVCVPTPQGAQGAASLTLLRAAIDMLAPQLADDAVVVVKSTVPAGTCAQVQSWLRDGGCAASVVANPEFLREGRAMDDFFAPDRVVIGGDDVESIARVASLFSTIETNVIVTDWATAELSKQASNAYLATRLSFVNGLAQLADAVGADIDLLTAVLGADSRIGPAFLTPGPGWGGACLPKDTAALVALGRSHGVELHVANSAIAANAAQQAHVADLVRREAGRSLAGKRVAVWGLTFKAGTDDLRDSPSLSLVAILVAEGATVVAFDPSVDIDAAIDGVVIAANALDACVGADVLVVATEWPEFAGVDAAAIAAGMAGDAIVDARNCLDSRRLRDAGLRYVSLGRR
jgi:UDPglucose 6-dehydrogenase